MNSEQEDRAPLWEKYLQGAAKIPGFVWGSIINLKGELLKISSFDYAGEAFAYASFLETLEDVKKDCLLNVDIGQFAGVYLRTKKGAAFFIQSGKRDEYILAFFTWDVPVEIIPRSISQILQG